MWADGGLVAGLFEVGGWLFSAGRDSGAVESGKEAVLLQSCGTE